MTDAPRDAFDDLLQRVRPHRSDVYLVPGDDPTADELLQRITSTAPRRKRVRWTRSTVVVATACLLVGAGVTSAVLRSRTADDPTFVTCYSTTNAGDDLIMAVPGDVDSSPIEQCRRLWTDGTFSSGGAPELVACVTGEDLIAVLPGTETTCVERGWDVALLGGDPHPATELFGRLSDRFVGRCLDPAQAVEAVNDVLEELSLDWTVDQRRAVEGRCNTVSIEPATETIIVAELR